MATSFDDLPTEIVVQVCLKAADLASLLALSSACRRLRSIYHSSHKLSILYQVADNQFGPVQEIIQLVTQNTSQPAHVTRRVAQSDALLSSIVQTGRVAARWEQRYPHKKWKVNFQDRRLLTDGERRVFRRALYRLWLFTKAFHTSDHPRTSRLSAHHMSERAAFLHQFTTAELGQMLDVHAMARDTISSNICPSNGTIRRKFTHRFPDSTHQLLFNGHPSMPEPGNRGSNTRLVPSRTHEPGSEGWGDEIIHYYVVEDMLKLDPAQILFLWDHAPFKCQVEQYVRDCVGSEWFENNGETFVQTLAFVLGHRGEELSALQASVADEVLGVAVR